MGVVLPTHIRMSSLHVVFIFYPWLCVWFGDETKERRREEVVQAEGRRRGGKEARRDGAMGGFG